MEHPRHSGHCGDMPSSSHWHTRRNPRHLDHSQAEEHESKRCRCQRGQWPVDPSLGQGPPPFTLSAQEHTTAELLPSLKFTIKEIGDLLPAKPNPSFPRIQRQGPDPCFRGCTSPKDCGPLELCCEVCFPVKHWVVLWKVRFLVGIYLYVEGKCKGPGVAC